MQYNFDKIINREATFSIKYDGRESYFETRDVLPMWVADMDFETPPFIRKAVISRAEQPIYGYSFRPDSYFNSIIDWVQKRHRWTIRKDWISFTPGIVPAIHILIQAFTKPGDKVLVQPPVYHPFFYAIENNHRTLVENELVYINQRYTINYEDLEAKLSSGVKLFLLCSPHNPVGRVWKQDELETMANLCLQYDVLMVSDEIHGDLTLPGHRHIPMASISDRMAERTITCIAPSKTFNLAGLATSSVIIQNESLRNQWNNHLEQLRITMGNVFGTVASIAAYNHGADWLDQLILYISENITFVGEYLHKNLPEITLIQPEATYLLWLDFNRTGVPPHELKKLLIEKAGLGFNDGRTFRTGGEGFQRMNVACPRSTVKEALERLENVFKNI